MKTEHLNLRLTKREKTTISTQAKKQGVTMTQLVVKLVKDNLVK